MNIIPFIMAGGSGARLWPLSNKQKPKQYHNVTGNGTLFEETINRLKPLGPKEVVIATSIDYVALTNDEIKKSGLRGTVLAEPAAKNTAAAVLYGAVYLQSTYEESIMVVSPADHYIKNTDEFTRILKLAVEEAMNDNLVTIGIRPNYPETGFGYIKSKQSSNNEILPVDCFVEKPDIEKAKKYLAEGNYFWNSGIFVWKTSVILKAFKKYMPDHVKAFTTLFELPPEQIASNETDILKKKKDIFNILESISIDYGIMEHAPNQVVIPADFGWGDLGSWNAIDDILNPLQDNNKTPDGDNTIFLDSQNCTAFPEKSRISIVGLENVVVVEANNEILVLNKNAAQKVKDIVDIIKKKGT